MQKLKVFLIAGESSGDYCGSKLIHSLKKKFKGELVLKGVGGEYMKEAGMASLFPISKIAVMGIVEILPKFFEILKLIKSTSNEAIKFAPDIVVTIDSPGFCLRVVKRIISLRKRGTKFVHYVSPSVWAYKKDRVHKFAKYYDLVLALLPFEPAYYNGTGLRCEYVGHHLLENDWKAKKVASFLEEYDIKPYYKILGVFVGSRKSEINALLPCFAQSVSAFVKSRKEKFIVVFPSVSKQATAIIKDGLKRYDFDYRIVQTKNYEEKTAMFQVFDLALVKSGTSSFELTFAKVPMVVGYKVHPITATIARKIFKIFDNIKYVSLTNILADKPIIPEFIQENCSPDNILSALTDLMTKKSKEKQLFGYEEVINYVQSDLRLKPSEKAAEEIIKLQK